MIQVIKYKCCGNIFAACVEPQCYIDKVWLRDLRRYVQKGHKVEMRESGDVLFNKCECNNITQEEIKF